MDGSHQAVGWRFPGWRLHLEAVTFLALGRAQRQLENPELATQEPHQVRCVSL